MDKTKMALFLKDEATGESSILSLIENAGAIGNSLEADIKLNDHRASGIHAYLQVVGSGIRIVDLGSRSGVFVDGMRVYETVLDSGQTFKVGSSEIKIQAMSKNASALKIPRKIQENIPTPQSQALDAQHKQVSRSPFITEQKLLQVSLFWGQKLLDVRTFEPGSEITIGTEKTATFYLSLPEKTIFKIAGYKDGQLELFMPGSEASGVIWIGQDVYPIEKNLPEKNNHPQSIKLRVGDRADIQIGELALSFRFVHPSRKIIKFALPVFDKKLLQIIGAALLLYLIGFLSILFSDKSPAEKKTVEIKMPEKLKRVLYEVGMRSAEKKQESAIGEIASTGGRARSEEGASKSMKSPDQKPVEKKMEKKKEMMTAPAAYQSKEAQISSVFDTQTKEQTVDTTALIAPKESGNTVSALTAAGNARGRAGLGAGGGGKGVGIGQLKGLDTGGGMGGGDYGLAPSKGKEIEVPQSDEIIVDGGLDPDIIAAIIQRYLPQIRHCYETQLVSKPDLRGKVSVYFKITGTGEVRSPKVVETSLKDAATESCILTKIEKWVFPKPKGGGTVGVKYPFLLMSTTKATR